ncbi:MAG: putative ABC transport system permease protein, partial [Halothiobacillaceae bacterium]
MLLARLGSRYLRQHPWFTLLTMLGVALGVAVVIAIDIANQSALRAFERSAETLAGRTTHEIVGGPRGLNEALYFKLRREGWREIAPVVEGYARLVNGST